MKSSQSSLPTFPSQDVRMGKELFGEALPDEQLKTWFLQEENAFFQSNHDSAEEDPWYAYMRYINRRLGYAKIQRMANQPLSVVAVGPGDGAELQELTDFFDVSQMACIEASKDFQNRLQERYPFAQIKQPAHTGDLDLEEASATLFLAFSVLHHIPNVSKIVGEASRVLTPGGLLIVREPCSAMGMWGTARSATPNERGIPKRLMVQICCNAGFELVHRPVPILLEPINKILKKTIGYRFVPFPALYIVDRMLSLALSWNDHYWRDSFIKKVGPSSYFYVFRKA